jgi:ABC-type phosphate transport system auxiliary subunit
MNFVKEGKKKFVAVAAAGIIGFGALGGGAFAYKDAWTAKIQQGMTAAATYVFKDDIEKSVKAHGDAQENNLKKWANEYVTTIISTLNEFKQNEIKRGKDEINLKVEQEKYNLKSTADRALQDEKNKQTGKTDATINQAKEELDAVVEEFLNQIPE